jgi:hypothetical protein
MMDSNVREASLLGLPTELRLKIYDLILQADVDCLVVDDIHHSSDSNGTQARLIPNSKAIFSSSIPWLNLLSTCHKIETELRSHVENASGKNTGNRTYVLELKVCNAYSSPVASRTVKWRRIPCPPNDARRLIIHVTKCCGPGPWTDGGSASLARAIYQILNHTVHLGPRMFRQSLLSKHMQLRELVINVDIGVTCNPPIPGCNTDAIINWQNFHGGWAQISRTGFFTDYLEVTRLRNNEGDEVEIPTEYQKLPALPGYWRGLGFQWGITGLQCANYFTL